jgi:hypothetical protein
VGGARLDDGSSNPLRDGAVGDTNDPGIVDATPQDARDPRRWGADGDVSRPVDGGAQSDASGACEAVGELANRMTLTDVATDVENAWGSYVAPTVLGTNANGKWWMGWSTKEQKARLTPIDPSFQRRGPDVILPDKSVFSIVAHDDGTAAAIVARVEGAPPAHGELNPTGPSAYLVKLRTNGSEVFRVHLRGGRGFTPDPNDPMDKREGGRTWFLPNKSSVVFDGVRYGIFYQIARHFLVGEVHQADEYVTVDASGKLDEGTRVSWIASHSWNLHQLLTSNGKIASISVAEPFPHRGVYFHRWDIKTNAMAWPPPAHSERHSIVIPLRPETCTVVIGDNRLHGFVCSGRSTTDLTEVVSTAGSF